jgi:hypothetical protein
MVVKTLTLQTADLHRNRFPDYIDPSDSFQGFQLESEIMASNFLASAEAPAPANKLLSKIQNEPSRHPSPQPTHLSVPPNESGPSGPNTHNGHRVLRSATVGYIAPEFKGKADQMKTGKLIILPNSLGVSWDFTNEPQSRNFSRAKAGFQLRTWTISYPGFTMNWASTMSTFSWRQSMP